MAHVIEEILATLDAEVAKTIAPFFEPLGAKHLKGESAYDYGPGPYSIKPTTHAKLAGTFFWWINRFVVGPVIFDIRYGDREFLLETRLYYERFPKGFAPWQLLTAAGRTGSMDLSGTMFVLSSDFMVREIQKIAEGLKIHWPFLSNPTPELIDRVLLQCEERWALDMERQRCEDRERATIRASQAFHAGRYAEARRLLDPFKDDKELAPSSAKILRLLKKKIPNE